MRRSPPDYIQATDIDKQPTLGRFDRNHIKRHQQKCRPELSFSDDPHGLFPFSCRHPPAPPEPICCPSPSPFSARALPNPCGQTGRFHASILVIFCSTVVPWSLFVIVNATAPRRPTTRKMSLDVFQRPFTAHPTFPGPIFSCTVSPADPLEPGRPGTRHGQRLAL
jgi:hypothetical protein